MFLISLLYFPILALVATVISLEEKFDQINKKLNKNIKSLTNS